MALPTYAAKDAGGANVTVNTLPPGGQSTGANSLPVVLASDDALVVATGAKADAAYADATLAAAGGLVALLKGIFGRLASLLLVDTVAHNAATDRGGTITAGGTAQAFMPANTARRGIAVQNQSSGDLYFSGLATAVAGPSSLKLAAGAYFETGGHVGTGALSIIGATTGQAFYAREW